MRAWEYLCITDAKSHLRKFKLVFFFTISNKKPTFIQHIFSPRNKKKAVTVFFFNLFLIQITTQSNALPVVWSESLHIKLLPREAFLAVFQSYSLIINCHECLGWHLDKKELHHVSISFCFSLILSLKTLRTGDFSNRAEIKQVRL